MAEPIEVVLDTTEGDPPVDGRSIGESIRGGATWVAALVRSAFSAQFRSDEENGSDREMLWVQDFGPDYVLVESNSPDLKPGQLFQVPFEINADDSVTFPARRDWTVVEMTPRTPPAPQAEEDPAPAEESAEESDVPSEELVEAE